MVNYKNAQPQMLENTQAVMSFLGWYPKACWEQLISMLMAQTKRLSNVLSIKALALRSTNTK